MTLLISADAVEANDLQPDVETEREKAAYARGFEAGTLALQKAMAATLPVGEGYGVPTWPVGGTR